MSASLQKIQAASFMHTEVIGGRKGLELLLDSIPRCTYIYRSKVLE